MILTLSRLVLSSSAGVAPFGLWSDPSWEFSEESEEAENESLTRPLRFPSESKVCCCSPALLRFRVLTGMVGAGDGENHLVTTSCGIPAFVTLSGLEDLR